MQFRFQEEIWQMGTVLQWDVKLEKYCSRHLRIDVEIDKILRWLSTYRMQPSFI